MKILWGMKLQTKLIIFSMLIAIVPLGILGYFSIYKFSNVVQEKVYQTMLVNMSQVNYEISYLIRDIEQLSMYIYSNREVQEVLSKEVDRSAEEKYDDQLKINQILNTYLGFKNWDLHIYLMGTNGDRYLTGDILPSQYDDYNENWGQFRKSRLASGNVVWDTHYAMKKIEDYGVVLSSGRMMKSFDNNEPLGYLMIDMMELALADKYRKLSPYPGGQIYLLDSKGYIISSTPNKQEVGTQLNEPYVSRVLKGQQGYFQTDGLQKNMVIYNSSKDTGFKLINVIPVGAVTTESNSIRNLTIYIIILGIIISFWLIYFISRTVTRPIHHLRNLMKSVEGGNLEVSFSTHYKDEVGQLGKSFNAMISQIKRLIREVYEKQLRVQEAELKAIQAQFNPHFLYNTLDSINWMARIHKLDDISKIAISLGELLRFSIRKGEDLIPIKEDIQQIENYLTIQNIRHRDKFQVVMDCDPNIMECYTLKLMLQPVVENAISHGLEMKPMKGTLRISGHVVNDDQISFEVSDDGLGIAPEVMERLQSGMYVSDSMSKTGVGLENLRKRLRLYFDDNFTMNIESKQSVGTTISITIPLLSREEAKRYGSSDDRR